MFLGVSDIVNHKVTTAQGRLTGCAGNEWCASIYASLFFHNIKLNAIFS